MRHVCELIAAAGVVQFPSYFIVLASAVPLRLLPGFQSVIEHVTEITHLPEGKSRKLEGILHSYASHESGKTERYASYILQWSIGISNRFDGIEDVSPFQQAGRT